MWQEWALYFLSPLALALAAWMAAGAFLALRRRRVALALAVTAFVGLWIASTPAVGLVCVRWLEAQHPALSAEDTPAADAIVLLGGMVSGPHPPQQPSVSFSLAASRVWHAAALHHAGKAKWIVVAAGNRADRAQHQAEADVIAQVLVRLGVPREAIVLERTSRTTRENARNVKPLLQALGAKRVLLVTSAQHMPRAMTTFVKVWEDPNLQLIAAVTDVRAPTPVSLGWKLWLPSLDGLITVTNALKEFAGMTALAIIGVTS